MPITRDLSLATLSANRQKLDDISSGFDGATTDFTLTVSSTEITPSSPNHLIISLNGVIQEPTTSYNVTGSTLSFTTAPASTATFFGVHTETTTASNPGTPPDGSVGTAQLSTANVAFDSTTLFIDSTNNRVGVGTITPATALDVTGTITADGLTVDALNSTFNGAVGITSAAGAAISEGLLIDYSTNLARFLTYDSSTGSELAMYTQPSGGSTKQRFRINSDGDITFYDSGGTSEKFFWDSSAERLGIGTTSPEQKLHVDQTSTGSVWEKISNGSNASGAAAGVLFGNDGGDLGAISILSSGNNPANALFLRSLSSNPLVFGTNNTEAMRIDSSGNVGIGTDSPSYPLHIDAAGMGDIYSGLIENTTTDTDHYNVIRFIQGATGSATGLIGTGGSATGNVAFRNNFVVGTQSNNDFVLVSNDTERLRIKASGDVGIGTTSPTGGNAPLTIKNVNGSGAQINFQNATATDAYIGLSGDANGNLIHYLGATNNQIFYTSGAEAMRIDSSGKVGIGTDNPDAKLRIQNDNSTIPSLIIRDGGTPAADMVNISSNATGSALVINSSGKVGIGTSSPTDTLTIVGGMRVSSIVQSGTYKGYNIPGNGTWTTIATITASSDKSVWGHISLMLAENGAASFMDFKFTVVIRHNNTPYGDFWASDLVSHSGTQAATNSTYASIRIVDSGGASNNDKIIQVRNSSYGMQVYPYIVAGYNTDSIVWS